MPADTPDWTAPGQVVQIDTAANVLPGAPVTHASVSVPQGTQTLIVLGVDQTTNQAGGHVAVTGNTSGNDYLGSDVGRSFPSTIPPGGVLYLPATPIDSTLKFVYDATGDVRVSFWVFASPLPVLFFTTGVLGVALEDGFGTLIDTETEIAANPLLAVTLSKANPAPWQVPDYVAAGTLAITVGTDFTLLAATANKSWRVFDCLFDTNSASVVVLELWDGPSATGTKIGEAEQNSQNNRPMRINYGGMKLTTGRALIGKCTFAAAGSSLFYTVPRSQV